MSHRLPKGGRLIDRSKSQNFTFNGKSMAGFQGDTVAASLLANDQMLLGRSFKYHRPRGVVAAGAEEPNALLGLGQGNRYEPNQSATTTELFDGLEAVSQNHWPSLEFDLLSVNNLVPQFLTAGFYYKTFLRPRAFWKHVYEPLIRRSAGLGKAPAPDARDPDRYEQIYAFTDILVLGGGIAGLQAALAAGQSGAKVTLWEQTAHWGGRAPVDGAQIDGQPAQDWINATVARLHAMDNVQLRTRCMGAGVHDHGYVLGYERVADHMPGADTPRHRLWRMRARQIITATGAIERPLSFAGNDVPGVMLASALRDYIVNYAVAPGARIVVVTNNDDAYRSAIAAHDAGLDVAAIIDPRAVASGDLPACARALGIEVLEGRAIRKVKGGKRVTGVEICRQDSSGGAVERSIDCDAVAMSGGWSPVVHLWSHCGGKLIWDEAGSYFRPDPARPPLGADGAGFVRACGAANGELLDVLSDAHRCARMAAQAVGANGQPDAAPQAIAPAEAPMQPVWMMPAQASYDLRMKMWLDYQNDVKVSDVQLSAREGYQSVEHTKRYTTLGMATDQGKLSNINGLAILSDALGQPIPATGTTTFRPPYTPISIAAIAGEARGAIFQPLRRSPVHDWHTVNGADWEPVGQWRRPFAYVRGGETRHDAVNREVKNTRENVGLLDASTLGKILVRGPDAGRFLDMLYTNMISTLKPGKCRYGLMCNENGFLMDDGVVARLDADSFLVHTTSGGADHIHAWMEDWLQCEWWDWRVHTVNLTEQFAQFAVVGPKARVLLDRLGGMDVSRDALPFMEWRDGTLAGFDARVFRISFSGELSFEIAVPAGQGRAFWDRLVDEGADLGLMPYGTEALHILRAEKGFIMIGDETDGTVIPQDLGLDWAISKKKADFLGKRGMEREAMVNPDRWKLVGVETLDGQVLPHAALAVTGGKNANGQAQTEGRVTSTYYSANLGRGIAMALVRNGPDRMGDVLTFAGDGGKDIKARIIDPVLIDKEGAKQNV
ncbi:sarcosine oxidase subunit alpha family protein [Roseinatronobacter sp. S2]|uniref:sarcosine oxidase subunit alpha family protein n=1 Tax=Roseinatronobacter sp. S2 TaxID=3035471 RepID=UPI00240FA734|nr:sarcosine oxidase subunit alpha family protein [Roseinatronobacter sp. S2]WFE74224.1 sarcosine oxidase subunit alpha family protein [Roseinatronobacter sp. S2]